MERKEAIEVVKKNWPDSSFTMLREALETLVPELKESEDKKIRKALINYFSDFNLQTFAGLEPKKILAWLEKQSEQKPAIKMKTPEESLGISSDDYKKIVDECIYGEQKPADNAEPKFHKGDWVVYCNDDVDLITGIEENGYCINNGGYIPFVCENEMRLWDITDAKVGDVLVSESTCGLGTWYCIFKSLDGDESMTVYCYLARDGRVETKKELCFDKDPYNTKPATKEQRDTLEKAMADAGYEWDAEKLELRKIGQKKTDLERTPFQIEVSEIIDAAIEEDEGLFNVCEKLLSLAKNEIEQKPAWSEEDKKAINDIMWIIEAYRKNGFNETHIQMADSSEKWLKSLKERYTWKPSNEQIYSLDRALRFYGKGTAVYDSVKELLEQLKKLKG